MTAYVRLPTESVCQAPFRGLDPLIEATEIWQSCHHALITACHDQLNERLPADYVAAMEGRVVGERNGDASSL